MSRYLILGDVHAEFELFQSAVKHAQDNNLPLISVGDIVDNGPDGYKVCQLMLECLIKGDARIIWGNHEHKIFSWLSDKKVKLGPPNIVTTTEMETNIDFQQVFVKVCNFAEDIIEINPNVYVTHAGVSPQFWNSDRTTFTKEDLKYFKWAETDHAQGTYFHKGQYYPHRTYNWCDQVPADVTVFVGHDPDPLKGVPTWDEFQKSPYIYHNLSGGKVVFLDCGSGKGGWLYGAVLNSTTNQIEEIIKFTGK